MGGSIRARGCQSVGALGHDFRRTATGVSLTLRARSVPGSVPESDLENGGARECLMGRLRGFSGCELQSIQKVSREFQKGVPTLRGRFRDTL